MSGEELDRENEAMRKQLPWWSWARLALMRAMGRWLPTCEEVGRLSSEEMDGHISLRSRILIRMHLLMCEWCRLYRKQLALIRLNIRRHPTVTDAEAQDGQAALSPEATERIRQALNKAP